MGNYQKSQKFNSSIAWRRQ